MIGADAVGGEDFDMVRNGGDFGGAVADMRGDQQRIGLVGMQGGDDLRRGHFLAFVRAIVVLVDAGDDIGGDLAADNQAWLHRISVPRNLSALRFMPHRSRPCQRGGGGVDYGFDHERTHHGFRTLGRRYRRHVYRSGAGTRRATHHGEGFDHAIGTGAGGDDRGAADFVHRRAATIGHRDSDPRHYAGDQRDYRAQGRAHGVADHRRVSRCAGDGQ